MKKLLRFLKPRFRIHVEKYDDGWGVELRYKKVAPKGRSK